MFISKPIRWAFGKESDFYLNSSKQLYVVNLTRIKTYSYTKTFNQIKH